MGGKDFPKTIGPNLLFSQLEKEKLYEKNTLKH